MVIYKFEITFLPLSCLSLKCAKFTGSCCHTTNATSTGQQKAKFVFRFSKKNCMDESKEYPTFNINVRIWISSTKETSNACRIHLLLSIKVIWLKKKRNSMWRFLPKYRLNSSKSDFIREKILNFSNVNFRILPFFLFFYFLKRGGDQQR